MKRLLATLLIFAAAAAHASITATLLDDDGKPLAGARVRAFVREEMSVTRKRFLSKEPETPPVASVTTPEDGKVSLEVKGNPVVRLVADAPGRAVQMIEAVDGEDIGSIILPIATTLKGRVVSGGKPVSNALMVLGIWYATHSDAQGNYEMPPTATSSERLYVIHPDYAIAETSIGPGDTTRRPNVLEIALTKGATIKGRVFAADGKTAVANAAVSVAGWTLARSGDDGAYTIAHAPQNWRAVFANTQQLAGVAMNRTGAASDIRALPAFAVSGVVKSAAGPVAGALVSIYNELDPGAALFASSDAKGRFAFDGLVAGRHTLFGAHPDFVVIRLPIQLPSTGERVLTADPMTRLRGHVVDEERKPVAAVRVTIQNTSSAGGYFAPPVTSGAAGEFTSRVRPGGNVLFVAARRGYAVAMAGPFTLEKAKDVTIVLPAGFPMTFHVVDGQREPVAHAAIDLARAADGEGDRRVSLPCVEQREDCRLTKADGTYDVRLVDGKYDLSVSGDEIAPKTLSGQALSRRSSPMTVTVDRGSEVSGRVAFSDGAPVAGAQISARAAVSRTVTSAADGTFTLKGLPAGPVSITASTSNTTPGMSGLPVVVTAPAKNVLLRIPQPTALSGRVVEKTTGQPVTDFQIQLTSGDFGAARPLAPSPIHSDDGTFTVQAVPGRTNLQVTAAGYVRATLGGLAVEEGKPLSGLEVKLERGGRIVGRVTSGGQPVAQVYVSLASDRFGPASNTGGTTDASGEYQIGGIEAGERTVNARKQGLLPKEKTFTVKADEEVRVDLDLERGRELHGRVIDRAGRPIESARVQLRSSDDRSTRGNAVSDPDGNFKVEGLPDGRLTLTAERDGYVASVMEDVDPAQNTLVTLDRGGSISGRVTGLSDAEIGTVSVSASYAMASANAKVDSDGTFTLRGLPDGTVSLTAMKVGPQMRRSAPKQVAVTNGAAPFVEIDFAEGISVRGRVTREGQPVMGGSISFNGMKGEQGGAGPLAPDGSYQVSGLQAGDYRVLLALYGINAPRQTEKLTVTSSMTHDIDLRGSTMTGRVVDASTGAPLSDVMVMVRSSAAEGASTRQTVSDSDGRFLFDLLQDGQYVITTQRQQYAQKQQNASVPSSELEIRLDATHSTIVRVVDATTGASLAGDVTATDVEKKTSAGYAHAGAEGAARLWLAPGHYTLNVTSSGYTSERVDVVVPSPDLRVALQRGGTILFRVHGPETNYRVRLLVNGLPQRIDFINTTFRNAIAGVAPGTYMAEVTGPDGKTSHGTYPVTVVSGQTAFVDVVN